MATQNNFFLCNANDEANANELIYFIEYQKSGYIINLGDVTIYSQNKN